MGTSYIPFPPWALGFCFVPLWVHVVTKSQSPRQAFFAGWLTQFVLSLIGFYWVAVVAHDFGYMPWPVAIPLLLLFAAAVHLYYPIATGFAKWLWLRGILSRNQTIFMGALLVSLGEMFWPSLFPWNLGYPLLATHSPLAQWADSIGFWGLSLLIHLFQALVAVLVLEKKPKLALQSLGTAVIVIAILYVGGLQKQKKWRELEASFDQTLNVLVVQANIGNLEKIIAEKGTGFQQEISDRYSQLTTEALSREPKVDLIVWPESAFPQELNEWARHRTYSRQFFELQAQIQKPILTGAYSSDAPGTPKAREYNGLFLFDEHGQPTAPPYHKTYLLAYGEYTPGYDWFPALGKYSPAGEGFGRGPGPTVMPFRDWQVGVQICYESLEPQFTAQLARLGAGFLVNLTNDSWFGDTFEPQQNLYMTLGRAVESRLPLVRSTNTGVTTAISASGDIQEKSPLFQTWTHVFKIQLPPASLVTKYLTLHSRVGVYFPWALALVVIFWLAYASFRPKRKP